MREIEVDGHTYSIGSMPTMKQVLIAKKLLPMAGQLVGALGVDPKELKAEIEGESKGRKYLAAMIGPVTSAITAMSDEDVVYLLGSCLECARRRDGTGAFAPVWNAAAGQPMFADINLTATYMLVSAALLENFGPFFGDLISRLPAPPLPPGVPSPG